MASSDSDSPKTTTTPPKGTITWMGFARRVPTERGTLRIHLLWGRIAVLFVALVLLGWFSVATALYFFFREVREFEEVAYGDMVLFPLRRDSVRQQQGDYEIEQALLRAEEGDVQRALRLARQGVARSPRNTEGRMFLARVYAGFRPDLSLELLEGGLAYAEDDLDYQRLYIQLLLQEKRDEQVVDFALEVLSRDDVPADIRTVFALAGMRAALMRGQYPTAVRLFEENNLWRNIEGITLAGRLLQRVGKVDEAVELLTNFTRAFRDQPIEPVYTTLLRILVEEERFSEASDIALDRSFRNPLDWQPRLDLLNIHHKSGREARARREALEIARQFRGEERAMAALAQFATDAGDINLARRVYETALENNHSIALFGLLFIEAHLTAGNYEQGIRFCNELAREQPAWLREYESVFASMRSIAYFGVGNEELGRVYLREFMDSPRTTPGILVSVGQRFADMGRIEEARRLFTEGVRRDAENEAALARLVELELDLGESIAITEHVSQLLEMRRPGYSLLERLHRELGSDRFLFTPGRRELVSELSSVLEERDVDTDPIRLPS